MSQEAVTIEKLNQIGQSLLDSFEYFYEGASDEKRMAVNYAMHVAEILKQLEEVK